MKFKKIVIASLATLALAAQAQTAGMNAPLMGAGGLTVPVAVLSVVIVAVVASSVADSGTGTK